MKVLYVQDSLGTGGAERSNAELWYYLRDKGVTIKIIALEHRTEGIEDEILRNGFDVHFVKPGSLVRQAKQISEIIKIFKPNLVHSVLIKASFRTRMAKLWSNFHHIESLVNCTYDNVRLQDPRVNKWGLKFYELVDRFTHPMGTDAFIAITEAVESHYIKHLKIPRTKISVIYRGRSDNPFFGQKTKVAADIKKELDFKEADLLFLHVGRQEFQKGHINLLKAIKFSDDALSALNVKFLFCGREGNSTDKIKDFIEKANIQTEIKFLGHRNDVNNIMAGSDVFVFPSLYEGLGGSLIEAQAAGLPVICSNLDVFREIVEEGRNAKIFHKSDYEELGNALVVLAKSHNLRKEMGMESHSNFQEKFKIEQIHSMMLNHYKKSVI